MSKGMLLHYKIAQECIKCMLHNIPVGKFMVHTSSVIDRFSGSGPQVRDGTGSGFSPVAQPGGFSSGDPVECCETKASTMA